MKRRILTLTLVLLWAVMGTRPAAAAERGLVRSLKAFFIGVEGDYGSVNPNDNGALSVGILQWHGSRALDLCRAVLDRDAAAALYLTAELYAELDSSATDWSFRTLTGAEARCLSALLDSRAGRALQDETADAEISGYLADARAAGMGTEETVFYYATIRNQFGPVGAQVYLGHVRETLGLAEDAPLDDLNALHAAVHATDYGQRYLPLRDKTYVHILARPYGAGFRAAAVTGAAGRKK